MASLINECSTTSAGDVVNTKFLCLGLLVPLSVTILVSGVDPTFIEKPGNAVCCSWHIRYMWNVVSLGHFCLDFFSHFSQQP